MTKDNQLLSAVAESWSSDKRTNNRPAKGKARKTTGKAQYHREAERRIKRLPEGSAVRRGGGLCARTSADRWDSLHPGLVNRIYPVRTTEIKVD